jgi:hypothetical protein
VREADSAGQPWAGRTLSASPFAADDGAADPALMAALTAAVDGRLAASEVVSTRVDALELRFREDGAAGA